MIKCKRKTNVRLEIDLDPLTKKLFDILQWSDQLFFIYIKERDPLTEDAPTGILRL